jgi:hypothetical protein
MDKLMKYDVSYPCILIFIVAIYLLFFLLFAFVFRKWVNAKIIRKRNKGTGRSVGIVRSRTTGHGVFFFFNKRTSVSAIELPLSTEELFPCYQKIAARFHARCYSWYWTGCRRRISSSAVIEQQIFLIWLRVEPGFFILVMPGCTAPNCTNSSQKGFKLYHFPTDKERSSVWVRNCGRERGWKPTKHTCVCEVS